LPATGLHMLPNLKFLICGILFCVLLFVMTGAGVMLPDSRTHIGEMPEIGRPMMQRVMAEEPALAQFHLVSKTASVSVPVPHPEIGSDVIRNELDRIAALPPSAEGELNAPTPRLIVVPLPHLRRFARLHNVHRRMFHRKHRVAQAPYNTFDQVLSMQRSLSAPRPPYPPPHAGEGRVGDAEQIAPGDAT